MAEFDFRPVNLAQIYGAADQANALKNQQQYQQYQIGRQMQDDQRSDAMRGAYAIGPDGELDTKQTLANLYRIDPIAANQLKTSLATQEAAAAKAGLENQKTKLEITSGLLKNGRESLVSVNDQASYDAWRQGQIESKAPWAAQLSPTYSPDIKRQYLSTADQAIGELTPKFEKVDLGGKIEWIDTNPITNPAIKGTNLDKALTPGEILTDERTRTEGKLNRGVTMRGQDITVRGQNMTDARAKEANTTGKAPSGFRWKEDGTLEAIPGGPGDKKANPTEGQGKASLYATRASEADKILNDVEGKFSRTWLGASQTAQDLPLGGLGIGAIANQITPKEAQQADQAQRNFINAILRQESGAAISSSEFDNAKKQYFPKVGDSDEVVKQKAENRKTAIEQLDKMAGPLGKSANKQNIIPQGERMPSNNGPVARVKSDKDYNSLPKGTRFIAPDGSERIKP